MGANESQENLIGRKLLSYGVDKVWPILALSSLMGLLAKAHHIWLSPSTKYIGLPSGKLSLSQKTN